jgi:hypothetical protein
MPTCAVANTHNRGPVVTRNVMGKGGEVQHHSFLKPWQEEEASGQLHAPAALPQGKEPQIPTG